MLRAVVGWLAAGAVLLLRLTCRVRVHDDPRPALRRQGVRYAYAFLHAHQIATVLVAEAGTGAMVSRSADGDLLVPSLRVTGVVPVRGSGRRKGKDKGGSDALAALMRHSATGAPVYLAVDGPLGPRNHVRRGIVQLATEAGVTVLVAVAVPKRRWVLRRTWDRFQIPQPFSVIDYYFGVPVRTGDADGPDALRDLINARLDALEALYDPAEALARPSDPRPCLGSGGP